MNLLTVREAAARLHVSIPTMRRLIAAGDFPVVIIRRTKGKRTIRVRPETLERLIRERETRTRRDGGGGGGGARSQRPD